MTEMVRLNVTVAEVKMLGRLLARLNVEVSDKAGKPVIVPPEVLALAREAQEKVTTSSARVAKTRRKINRLKLETRAALANLEAII